MAEPTAQQLARQRLANTDLAKFAPPSKRKKTEPEPTKYTKQAVKTSAEERKAHKKAYAHAYYLAHKDEKKKRDAEYRQKNPELYRSNSLQWYYEHKEHCNARNKEWRGSHKEQKLENHRKWMAKHPGYYTKEQKQKRKEQRENGTRIQRGFTPDAIRKQPSIQDPRLPRQSGRAKAGTTGIQRTPGLQDHREKKQSKDNGKDCF